jgi:transcriptional regulator with XRE-family HTH domain
MHKITASQPNQTLSERISARMEDMGLTQAKLAEISGVERSVISRCLRAARPWRLDQVRRLAPAFGCSLEEFIKDTPEETLLAGEDGLKAQLEGMQTALAEAIARAQTFEAQKAAAGEKLLALQEILDQRPSDETLRELQAKLVDAENREAKTAHEMEESQKKLEEERSGRRAAEKQLEVLDSRHSAALKLAEENHQAAERNHQAAEHNERAASHWKAQFEALTEQLQKETKRANHNYAVATEQKGMFDKLAADKKRIENHARQMEALATHHEKVAKNAAKRLGDNEKLFVEYEKLVQDLQKSADENANLAQQNAEIALTHQRRASAAESEAGAAKGLAFLTTTLGAMSIFGAATSTPKRRR